MNMNKKTILKSTIVIVAIALLCFGILWLFLFRFNNIDAGSAGEPFNSSNAQKLVGSWETIEFKTSDGSPMPHEGIFWVFSESEVRYFENEVELLGRPFAYQWTNNDTIRMTDDATSDQRIWQLMFNGDNNLIVNEPNGYIRTLVRVH
jgi:hypothetical protein